MTSDRISQFKKALSEAGWYAAQTAAVSAVITAGVSYTVPVLGFTAKGIAAGSLASYYQSKYLRGRITRGSSFWYLQKIGAKGLTTACKVGIIATSAVAIGVYTVCKKLLKKTDKGAANDGTNDGLYDETNEELYDEINEELYDEPNEESDNIDEETIMESPESKRDAKSIDSEWETIEDEDLL